MNELRTELKARSLPAGGSKAELVRRLSESLLGGQAQEKEEGGRLRRRGSGKVEEEEEKEPAGEKRGRKAVEPAGVQDEDEPAAKKVLSPISPLPSPSL